MSAVNALNGADVLAAGEGILRLAPTWVPRPFGAPGRRLRLHPADIGILGAARGSICERWLASTVQADNGLLTPAGEGVSQVVAPDGTRLGLDRVVAELGPALIGERLWAAHGGLPMFAKFFDYAVPLPYHVHPDDRAAARVGKRGKPEAYFFPAQMNPHLASGPMALLGLAPGTTRDEVRASLAAAEDPAVHGPRITDLSVAYRMELDTAWDIPAGVLHAPASLCTYEPQGASDVMSVWDPWAGELAVPGELRWRDVPPDRAGDVDALLELLDWEANVDPDFVTARRSRPVVARQWATAGGTASQAWVCFRSSAFSAASLTIPSGGRIELVDELGYGCVAIQGHGRLGPHQLEAITMVRYGDLTHDEYLVSEARARAGVVIENRSASEPLVLLQHFGPGHPALPT